jgi:MFS family permease
MNKKYMPSALILYLNYFIHGIGCSILGQAVIKEALAASWGVEAMAITAISAALGLGRLIALPFAGPLSDKLGRRISTAIGSGSYAIYLIGLALAFNAGTNGGYTLMYVRSSEVLQTPSWIQEFIRQLQRSSTKHRVLLQWELNFSLPSHR